MLDLAQSPQFEWSARIVNAELMVPTIEPTTTVPDRRKRFRGEVPYFACANGLFRQYPSLELLFEEKRGIYRFHFAAS